MIWGEQDLALGVELTYGTDALVRDLTLRYLPHASHWVQQDAPEDVNAMLEAWLCDRPVPGARRSSQQAREAA
jgi:pimeloyl-ACP methyl ester carboxylesterase